MVTEVSWFEYCNTIILVSSMPNLCSILALEQRLGSDEGRSIPVGDQLGQLRVAVAREQLDRIRCHSGSVSCL